MTSSSSSPLERLLSLRVAIRVPGAGAGAEVLREILVYMHAPDHLAGVYKVARNTIELLDLALTTLPLDSDMRSKVCAYRAEFAWVKSTIRKYMKRLSDDLSERKRMLKRAGTNPVLKRGALEHGLWCLLWHDHKDGSLATIFRVLQLRGLFAQIAVVSYWSGHKKWEPGERTCTTVLRGLYRETLAIRCFVTGRNRPTYERILHQIQAENPTASTITEVLKKIAAQHAPEPEKEASAVFRALCSILWLFRREEHPERVRTINLEFVEEILRPEGKDTGAPIEEPDEEYELDRSPSSAASDSEDSVGTGAESDNSERGPAEVETLVRRRWADEQIKGARRLALHPAEILPTTSLHLSYRRSGARGGLNWRARDNQLLPWSLKELPLEMAAEALEILRLAAENGGTDDVELFALAMAIFRLGCTMPAALEITLCSERPKDENVKTLTLTLPPDRQAPAEWVVPALPIPFRGEPVSYEGCREVVDAFVLPDFSRIARLVMRLINSRGEAWDGGSMKPFRSTQKEYASRLAACLSRCGTEESKFLASCCTFERLSMVRFLRIYEIAGENIVPATYSTLRTHDTGEVPRYYETLQVRTIQDLDRESMINIYDGLKPLGFLWPVDDSIQPSDSHGHVGSPYCPSMEALKLYLLTLRSRITNVNRDLGDVNDPALVILRHNLYVTYTQVGYLIGTCHRAVQDAYADLEEIEPNSQLLTILDKGPRGRLVPVCDSIWTQMLGLRDYLTQLSDDGHLSEPPDLPIFLRGREGSVVPIREATLELPWPMNFGRHFVRTELATAILEGERSITIEQLKEFLGHAAEGEERDAATSTFNYRVYSRVMRAAMEQLLGKIEYWPIDITGNRIPVRDSSYVRSSLTA